MKRTDVIAYYETKHVPLILSLFPTISAYRRNYADFGAAFVNPLAAPFDFDIVTEIFFASDADRLAMFKQAADPKVLSTIEADEANFLESGFTRMFLVDSRETQVER